MILLNRYIFFLDIFRTDDKDRSKSKSSAYLDLSCLYGANEDEQTGVRTFKNGLLKKDTFAEYRLLTVPPAACALLVAFKPLPQLRRRRAGCHQRARSFQSARRLKGG